MRVEITPRRVDVIPGQPTFFSLTITNTSDVIGGFTVRALGVDPSWVSLEEPEVSLFPTESRVVTATVTVPEGIPAGTRRLAFQVRELTPPEDSSVTEIDLVVPAAPSVHTRVDPLAVHAGKTGALNLVVTNTGNTQLTRELRGDDAEGKVKFRFAPERVDLAPGEHAVVDVRARARRRLLGAMVVRVLSFYLDEADTKRPEGAARDDKDAAASATFIQRPVIARGGIALVGLLAAVTVFGLVITLALSKLVGMSAADRDLALQIAAAQEAGATTGTSSASGRVTLLTSNAPVPGVSVSLFDAEEPATPLTTTATDDNGAYSFKHLPAGDYLVSYRGAGLIELWFPGATSADDATPVSLKPNEARAGLDVRLGGVPASISGSVTGEDVAGATVSLETMPFAGTVTGDGAADAAAPATSEPGTGGGAVVQTVPVGTDGSFSLADVPSPSIYTLKVTKTGYATSTQRLDIDAGENRKGVQVMLRKGDGVISGTVTSSDGPVGKATITATAGEATSSTVSGTGPDRGAFTLRGLPTPATVTLTISKAHYASETMTLTLGEGQKLTGVTISLSKSSGSLHGSVTLVDGGRAATGVMVTITNGSLTVSTQTGSTGEDAGTWQVGGLPVPGVYTVTFARPDLLSQTLSVSLNETDRGDPIPLEMRSSTATLGGKVTQHLNASRNSATVPVGEATITLSSGTSTYTVTTASTPQEATGRYRIEHLPPGTYTMTVSSRGTRPTSQLVTLVAGNGNKPQNPVLEAAASIRGTVVEAKQPKAGWTVQLYRADQFPQVVAATVKTDAKGAFTFDGIEAPQAYVLVARPTPNSPAAGSVTSQVEASEQQQVRIEVDSAE
ncbi:MAG TPA: carboxypeptidase-like regulatory domain-containing protein [Nocardioidaceae bacterium]|nr:carboxypeptidase-like regulatory domain-containing protein [Nocardioidaceae bacterium]